MASEFPKSFYRYNDDGEQEGKTFKSAEDVEPGWLTWEEFCALPVPKPKAPPKLDGAGAVDAGKRLVAAENDNARLKDSVKLLEDEAKLKDSRIAALEGQVDAQRAFLAQVRADENCPQALKDAIGELLGEEEEAAPAPKKKRKA